MCIFVFDRLAKIQIVTYISYRKCLQLINMLLKELIRFSTQHRTLYCVMILSIWIFLIIAGMYKYIGSTFNLFPSGTRYYDSHHATAHDLSVEARVVDDNTLRLRQRCTSIEQLVRHEDGGILDGWRLVGVLLVIRHGDRGPMSHVRGVENINCGIPTDMHVNRYRSFLYNTTPSGSNHMYWNKVGPFHGFPLLPATERSCLLGQLTYKGIAQLLHVGELLHQIYAHPLGLLLKQPTSNDGSTPHSLLNSDEVVLYTTRYRRTFQSALALLFTLLPVDKWLMLNVRESHSFYFCFSDCACSYAEELRKYLALSQTQLLKQHTAVGNVMQWVGGSLLQHTPNGIKDLNEVMDAVLTVACHDAVYPCYTTNTGGGASAVSDNGISNSSTTNMIDLNDVINIDQDDTAANLADTNLVPAVAAISGSGGSGGSEGGDSMPMEGDNSNGSGCIEHVQIATLISYAQIESNRIVSKSHYKRLGLLRAYGIMRHIVSFLLKMISGGRTKLVLYSGHDWTLQYLIAALGIHADNTFIPYAARLAIELYRSETHPDYYFRLVYNGRDVTQQTEFCAGGRSLRVTRDSRGNKADLCPIENIIRFLHEDYFAPLNSTNFKDACSMSSTQRNAEF